MTVEHEAGRQLPATPAPDAVHRPGTVPSADCRARRPPGRGSSSPTASGGRTATAAAGARPVELGSLASTSSGRRAGAAGRAAGLLRRGRDGDQGAGLDGPGLRPAGVLLPRDRPQPAGGARASRTSAWSSSTTSPTCRPARPLMLSAHGSAPEVVEAATPDRRLRGRRGLPAGDQGPPRGEGAGRAGLPHHLRRPRGPRGGGRHHGRGPRRHLAGGGRRRRRRAARHRRSPPPCWPRPRCRTATGPACSTRPGRATPTLWQPGRSDLCFATTNRQAALAGDRPPLRRHGGDRLGQLVQHPGARAAWRTRPAAPACYRVNDADELPDDLAGTVGVTAGASAPEELVDGGHRPARPPSGRRRR